MFCLCLCALGPAGGASERETGGGPGSRATEKFRIYLDASQSGGSRAAGVAIERGIATALAMHDGKIGGRRVELVVRDHRGSTPRSRRNFKEASGDERTLVIFGGMHSPPILAQREAIQEAGIPYLVPWAAAGPITRGPFPENFVFRLSVDDEKAGLAITQFAVAEGFKRPFLLLEETGWGESNLRTLTRAIEASSAELAGVARFGWGSSVLTASELLEDARLAGADVVFLLANTEEGVNFAKAMLQVPEEHRLAIRSHWGITGGDFAERLGLDLLSRLDLRVIQTRFSFATTRSPLIEEVLRETRKISSRMDDVPVRTSADVGFAHAFDLTLLLIEAAKGIEWSGDIVQDRQAIRLALENLDSAVVGLVRSYRRPFSSPSIGGEDAHEALGLVDLTLGRFGATGLIELPVTEAIAEATE